MSEFREMASAIAPRSFVKINSAGRVLQAGAGDAIYGAVGPVVSVWAQPAQGSAYPSVEVFRDGERLNITVDSTQPANTPVLSGDFLKAAAGGLALTATRAADNVGARAVEGVTKPTAGLPVLAEVYCRKTTDA